MKVHIELWLCIVFLIVLSMLSATDTNIRYLCIIAICVCIVSHFMRSKSNVFKMHLVNTDGVNEVLLLETYLHDREFLFMIDTGYAGPPVLSRSYLAVKTNMIVTSIKKRYMEILEKMNTVSEDDAHQAVYDYMTTSGCLSYTSGCTMRLMGIGSTKEQQADLLMCPMLKIKNIFGYFSSPKKNTYTFADMFVTNSLNSSVHIMTCDFLMHHAPCLIDIGNESLEVSLPPERYLLSKVFFHMYPITFHGGAFVVELKVDDEKFICTVDTGAPGPICLGYDASNRLKKCSVKERKILKQHGVNGEKVCSEIVESDVEFCDKKMKVPIFMNDSKIESVDGYIGLGFLRAFNILISSHGIGFHKNKNSFHNIDYFSSIAQNGTCETSFSCLKQAK